MPFRVLCPSCSVKIKSPRKWAGKMFTCPRCQKPMRMPELADADVYTPVPRSPAGKLEPIFLDEPAPGSPPLPKARRLDGP
jgi:hypothetical protein